MVVSAVVFFNDFSRRILLATGGNRGCLLLMEQSAFAESRLKTSEWPNHLTIELHAAAVFHSRYLSF